LCDIFSRFDTLKMCDRGTPRHLLTAPHTPRYAMQVRNAARKN